VDTQAKVVGVKIDAILANPGIIFGGIAGFSVFDTKFAQTL
jgi:hypothetical protein